METFYITLSPKKGFYKKIQANNKRSAKEIIKNQIGKKYNNVFTYRQFLKNYYDK